MIRAISLTRLRRPILIRRTGNTKARLCASPAQLLSPVMMHLNKALGGTDDNFDPVIEKFREL